MSDDHHARELNLRRRLRDDLPFYAARALKIKTKGGGLVPFRFNRAQSFLHHAIEAQRAKTGKVRVIGLKGRQQGFSTYVEGRFYWRVTHSKGTSAYILTHEQPATDNLFSMAERYHEHCHPLLKPSTGTANAKELHFDRLDSGYRVGTAGSKAVGRSSTLQLFHGSEVAFWPNAADHLAGVMQAVPSNPGTEVILESTANGVGGIFHELWTAATRGENDYLHLFVPWYWQPEYRRSDPEFRADDEERALAQRFALDTEQLAWRRSKIAELCSSDLFKQEYPCTHEEAFLYSGRPVFERDWLAKARRETCTPLARKRLIDKTWTVAAEGELRVWAEPKPDTRYVIGADVAEGLEHGDYSCADVLECPGGVQVAQWHGHIAPDLFGTLLARLGRHYGTAFIGVERNNHGLTTLTKLRDDGYPNLYAQAELEYRGSADKETKRIGWLTTQKSKFKIIDTLAGELRDGDHGLLCRETLDELYSFVIHDNGHYGAQVGYCDDRVMSRAIAGEMLYAQGYGRQRERHPKEQAA